MFSASYLTEAKAIIDQLDPAHIEAVVDLLVTVRERQGRLFFIGSGGGAGHASHAVCDFRKLAGFEAYSPLDNLSELTAQINDNGWDASLANILQESRLNARDAIFVFSVGGGNADHNISLNLVRAMQYAKEVGAAVTGVVGRDGGYTAQVADACVVVPVVNASNITPHTESFQALVWHLLVSHPKLQAAPTKWESTVAAARP